MTSLWAAHNEAVVGPRYDGTLHCIARRHHFAGAETNARLYPLAMKAAVFYVIIQLLVHIHGTWFHCFLYLLKIQSWIV